MSMRFLVVMSVLGTLPLGACVELNGRPRGAHDAAPAMLRVHTEPANARVRIDDETVVDGRAIAAQPVELHAGHHLITVEADGFYPHDLELDLPAGETRANVRLRPLPP